MTYTFFISTASSVTYQVYPLNWLDCSLVWEKEKDEVFYRQKFEGNLTFGGKKLCADFNFLYSLEVLDPCQIIYLIILKDGDIYWEGYFATGQGEWDLDAQTFTVTPITIDDYTLILDEAAVQYDILVVSPTVTTHALRGTINIYYTRNRWLMDVITYLALQISPTSSVSSTFFTATINPVTLAANGLLNLTIAHKSDIIRPTSSNPASHAYMSWIELMDILWGMFQVKWNYDADTDVINVEHISWFSHGAGLDLRTQEIGFASNKYKYLKERMPKYERWHFMESSDSNFVNGLIWYNSNCVNQDPNSNTKETNVNVTTDVEFIASDPDAIADEGFVIMANVLNGSAYEVELGVGISILTTKLNMRLSWANLHNAYFRHERVLIEGIMNGSAKTFWTAQKTKTQEHNAILCTDFDPKDYITTELGETYFGGIKAYVDKAVVKPYGEVNFTLVYGPAENDQTEIADEEVNENFVTASSENLVFDYDDDTSSEYQEVLISMFAASEPFTVDLTDAAWIEYEVYAADNVTEITGNPALWGNGCYLRLFPINANGGAEVTGTVEVHGTGADPFLIYCTHLGAPATVNVYGSDDLTITNESGLIGVGGIHIAFTPHYVPGGDMHYDVCWFVKKNGAEAYSSLTTGLACTNDSFKNSTLISTPGLTYASGDVLDVYLYYESAPALA